MTNVQDTMQGTPPRPNRPHVPSCLLRTLSHARSQYSVSPRYPACVICSDCPKLQTLTPCTQTSESAYMPTMHITPSCQPVSDLFAPQDVCRYRYRYECSLPGVPGLAVHQTHKPPAWPVHL